ncbi:choice-of-anchor P family protein [Streptomyces sp. NPDC001941]|uniref:choice-of-anchor P family protein n=1 Tax=Streptomyces sp. NPDC001941 TaxID=3154659 RepID=UPI003332BFC6
MTPTLVAAAALLALAAPAVPAGAAGNEPPPASPYNWGTVLDTDDVPQSNSWAMRVTANGDADDIRLAETHSPAYEGVPEEFAGATGTRVEIEEDDESFGHIADVSTTARPNAATAAVGDLAFRLGRLGIDVRGLRTGATASPGGGPVAFTSALAGGRLTSGKKQLYAFDRPVPVNTGVRVPADPRKPAELLVTVNEQITTDGQGRPTMGPGGRYLRDPAATGGYVNALHVTILSPEPAEMTIGHAAVLAGRPATR